MKLGARLGTSEKDGYVYWELFEAEGLPPRRSAEGGRGPLGAKVTTPDGREGLVVYVNYERGHVGVKVA